MKDMIRKTSKRWCGQWDEALPFILGEYRHTPNSTTGFTPSELLLGRQMDGPLQALKDRWTGRKSTPKKVITYITTIQDKLEALRSSERE